MSSIPRGVRNKNPLNIRIGNDWVGEVENPTDPEFEQFTSLVYGLRAGFKLIRRYIEHYHRNTISKIIQSWAPASENNTDAYISFVSYHANLSPDQVLHFADKVEICNLVAAMCRVETGVSIERSLLEQAYNLVSK